jgi:hypothetical protein
MATFTYESIKNRFKNPTVDGNLELLDDGAIIKIGADNDIQLSHSGTAGTLTILNGFTIDIVDDLVIDVDGGDIALKDAGTQFGGLSNSSGHLLLKDGTTTFLTGNGANATFAGTLATTGVLTADAGINVDNITIDGTEIDLSSGDLTVDVAGDIILDAGGADILLKDDGTQYGAFNNSSNNLRIFSGTTLAATFSGANVTFAGTVSDSSGNIASSAYPVGAVFIAVVSTNPSSLLGFGSWSAFGTGRMLIGIDGSDSDFNTVEETGGSKTHTLTTAELPSHAHHVMADGGTVTNYTSDWGTTNADKAIARTNNGNMGTSDYHLQYKDSTPDRALSSTQGSGNAHNNMPPYIAVYMWKRTS